MLQLYKPGVGVEVYFTNGRSRGFANPAYVTFERESLRIQSGGIHSGYPLKSISHLVVDGMVFQLVQDKKKEVPNVFVTGFSNHKKWHTPISQLLMNVCGCCGQPLEGKEK